MLLAAPAGAAAAPELVQLGEFSEPVALAAAPSDGSRLFVVERGGMVRLLKHGVRAPAPFADLTSKVLAGGERGLLGMAFAPDYAASGRAYVFLTAKSPAGQLQIRELRRRPPLASCAGAQAHAEAHGGGSPRATRAATSSGAAHGRACAPDYARSAETSGSRIARVSGARR